MYVHSIIPDIVHINVGISKKIETGQKAKICEISLLLKKIQPRSA